MSKTDDQMRAEVVRIVEKNPKNFIKVLKSKCFMGRHEDRTYLLDFIMRCTPMLVDDDEFKYALKTRVYWVVNSIEDWSDKRVQCQACSKPLVHTDIKKLKDGYPKSCCKKCERKLAQLHIEQRMMQQHGVKNPFQLKLVIDKLHQKKDIMQAKRDSTKRKNKTFNVSKKEDHVYELLCKEFSSNDVIRQFKDIERYPFNCDFYIKSLDMFIECNFSWTHGGHWFDSDDPNDIARADFMKSKHSKYYDNALETWTVRDVKKRTYAQKNRLNYVVLWNDSDISAFFASRHAN